VLVALAILTLRCFLLHSLQAPPSARSLAFLAFSSTERCFTLLTATLFPDLESKHPDPSSTLSNPSGDRPDRELRRDRDNADGPEIPEGLTSFFA
jgi:hypothetical protein